MTSKSNENDNIIPLDHLLKRQETGKLSPLEALNLDRALRTEAPPEGVFAPITLARPEDVAPVAYVIHKWRSLCLACNTEHKWSEVFALNHLRSPSGRTFIKHMVPCTRLEWQVPIVEHDPKTRTTPFCHDCIPPAADYLSTLPKPPEPLTILKYTGGPEPSKGGGTSDTPSKKPKGFTSADDLLI